LPKEHQANALSFNTARLHFAKQEYQNVLPLLQDVEYSDVFYMLDSKTTLFKTYFELNEYDALLSLAESFRVLLSRKKIISEQHRNNYTNFIRIALKIFRAEYKNKKQLMQIETLFNEAKGIADKGWLLGKYKAIGGETQ
jgi:glycyl-tRNA synthetase alpha subunit